MYSKEMKLFTEKYSIGRNILAQTIMIILKKKKIFEKDLRGCLNKILIFGNW